MDRAIRFVNSLIDSKWYAHTPNKQNIDDAIKEVFKLKKSSFVFKGVNKDDLKKEVYKIWGI